MTYDKYNGAVLEEVALKTSLDDPLCSVHVQRSKDLMTK